jgi:hypothetical protein
VELAEEEANADFDSAIDLGLTSGSGHEMSAGLALKKGDTADIDLFAFERAGKVNRIGGDAAH